MYKPQLLQIIKVREPLVFAVVLLHWVVGCATPWEKSALLSDSTPNITGVKGPTERSLLNFFKKKQDEDDAVAGKSLKPIPGTEEYLAATELYKDEKYEEARKAFRKIHKARKYKKSEIREDALFMEAEAAWQQDHYATAHDAYAVLLKDFPSTRHLNVVSERLFKIGRYWLDFPEVANLGEIKQVNFEDPRSPRPSEEPPKLPKSKPIFVMNLRNKQEPLFDTPGNGVASLTAVWMNDPTGPLADDAMMLVASYYARKGNYVEADRYFQNLRELYPSSRHVQNAFVIGSHVKLMSYQGPEYETRTLQEAQLLKESILNLYPDVDPGRIKDELARIEEAKAEVIWKRALFYERKGKKRACSIMCHEVITKYPKSPYAEKSRAKLVQLGPEYESGKSFLIPIETTPKPLYVRILEPPVPEWRSDPASIFRPRKKTKKTDDKSTKNAKPKDETTDENRSDADKDVMDSTDDEGSNRGQRRPRRLAPDNADPLMQPDDDDSESKPTKQAPASQASFR